MAQLSDMRARRIAPGDRPLADGAIKGLWLHPGPSRGLGKWILRFVSPVTGKRRDMGLGAFPDEVGIADARDKAREARKLIGAGKDPLDERRSEKAMRKIADAIMTFEQAARKVHDELKPGWKNPKHADQWINTLETYVFPKVGKRKVNELEPGDFADALRPIWLTKVETASRVRQRCHAVMQWCWAHRTISSNPLDVTDDLLPPQPGKRERTDHQPAMPWRDVPAFVKTLRGGVLNVTGGEDPRIDGAVVSCAATTAAAFTARQRLA